MIQDDWIVGRKEILAALHLGTWAAVCRWRNRYKLKFVRLPNGKPAILREVLNEWIRLYRPIRKFNLPEEYTTKRLQ